MFVPLFLKRQCDRTSGASAALAAEDRLPAAGPAAAGAPGAATGLHGWNLVCLQREVRRGEKEVGGSGGSFDPSGPLLTHSINVHIAMGNILGNGHADARTLAFLPTWHGVNTIKQYFTC